MDSTNTIENEYSTVTVNDTFTVSKTFSFDYSHRLHLLPKTHKCSNLHGHTGSVTFTISSYSLNEVGFVKDFNEFSFIKKWIDNNFDHTIIVSSTDEELLKIVKDLRHFVFPEIQTTSELLARYLANIFMSKLNIDFNMIQVDFSETPTSVATFTRCLS